MNKDMFEANYGFWDMTGKKIYYKCPRISVIKSTEFEKLETDVIPLEYEEIVYHDSLLGELVKNKVSKIYIDLSTKKDIEACLMFIVLELPSLIFKWGRSKKEQHNEISTVVILDEIFVGVKNNIIFYETALNNTLRSNSLFSEYVEFNNLRVKQ